MSVFYMREHYTDLFSVYLIAVCDQVGCCGSSELAVFPVFLFVQNLMSLWWLYTVKLILFLINAIILKKVGFLRMISVQCIEWFVMASAYMYIHTNWCPGHSASEYLKHHLDFLMSAFIFHEEHEVFFKNLFHLYVVF